MAEPAAKRRPSAAASRAQSARIKIGIDAHVLDGRSQGSKTVLIRLIDQLARRHPGVDVLVYCEAPHPELDFSLPNLIHRPVPHRGAIAHLMSTLPRAARADGLATMIFTYIVSPFMADATVFIHDVLPISQPRLFTRRFAWRSRLFFGMSSMRARQIFTISDYSRDDIRRVFPWTARKPVDVMHIGPSFPVDTYFETNAAHPADAPHPYVLCVGRIEPRKNVQLAIDAFRAGAPASARLIVVGSREPGIAIDTGGDPRIVERSGVSDEELVALYRGASLFLYPSRAEGFGLPLLDAILFGVPVISSSLTSMREIGEGFVEFFDPLADRARDWLAERIRGHFADSPVVPATVEQRRAHAECYAWSVAADEIVEGLERNVLRSDR